MNRADVFRFSIAPSSEGAEPPANPARFTRTFGAMLRDAFRDDGPRGFPDSGTPAPRGVSRVIRQTCSSASGGWMMRKALDWRAGVDRSVVTCAAFAITRAAAPGGFAQSAADHAALAHGPPTVNGYPVQPPPGVVEERLRHHREMLQAGRNGSAQPPTANSSAIEGTGPDVRESSKQPTADRIDGVGSTIP